MTYLHGTKTRYNPGDRLHTGDYYEGDDPDTAVMVQKVWATTNPEHARWWAENRTLFDAGHTLEGPAYMYEITLDPDSIQPDPWHPTDTSWIADGGTITRLIEHQPGRGRPWEPVPST